MQDTKNRVETIKAIEDPGVRSELCKKTKKVALIVLGIVVSTIFILGSTIGMPGFLVFESMTVPDKITIICATALCSSAIVGGGIIAVKACYGANDF